MRGVFTSVLVAVALIANNKRHCVQALVADPVDDPDFDDRDSRNGGEPASDTAAQASRSRLTI
jgi:hypothetical protein